MNEAVKRGRDLAPDVLKLTACVGVVVIHISGQGVTSYPIGASGWLSCVFWDSLARFAVPVFFMCTGALMLPPERTLTVKRIWTKYFLRVLYILLFWSFAYNLFKSVGVYVLEGWHDDKWFLLCITNALKLDSHFHLYYLQILLLLYAALPLLRVFTRAASRKELEYACGLWLILGIAFPLMLKYYPLRWFGGLLNQYALNMCWSAMGYALVGYYMFSVPPRREDKWKYVLLAVLGLAVTFGGTVTLSMASGAVCEDFMEGMSPGPAAMAIGLTGLVRVMCEGRSGTPALSRLVKASFCVYLIHHFFIMVFRYVGIDVMLFAPMLLIPLETCAVLALSLAGWWVLEKIPFVKDHLI